MTFVEIYEPLLQWAAFLGAWGVAMLTGLLASKVLG